MNIPVKTIIEALIFISLEPLSNDKIKGILQEFPPEDVDNALRELTTDYNSPGRGIKIIEVAGGYLFSTQPELDSWIRLLLHSNRKSKLSPAALETLSTIAYNQPITLAEISSVRGVDASHALKTLLQKKLIKIVGRKKAPGKPLLYRTSSKFLRYFGLNSLEELPSAEEISKMLEEEDDR